jgi:2,4-dienoyl-CoA reductase-like NADH-dependent reductase (Old Yellow Enzyme family)
MSQLFSPLTLRGVHFRHRVFVSPMCQYSATGGYPDSWHLVHLGSRAVGGAALVMFEATAVSPEGRISPGDLGLWDDAHIGAYRTIVDFIKAQGAVPGIQLAHAGRKGSMQTPWAGGHPLPPELAWTTVAPDNTAFAPGIPPPKPMDDNDLRTVRTAFTSAAQRAQEAGFEVLEIHMAHGYLLHQFLSPRSNHRKDSYGGDFAGRARFPLEITEIVRVAWPEHLPLFVRISATDWVDGGWDLDQSVQLARNLGDRGVDLIDCSSGGLLPDAPIPAGPGYQVPFAQTIRARTGIPTGAIGLITEPVQAEQIVATGQADAVFLARALLRDPYWPLRAAHTLRAELPWPVQYERAKFR